MDQDWKGEGTIPSSVEQIKVIFWSPKSSNGEESLGAQNYAKK